MFLNFNLIFKWRFFLHRNDKFVTVRNKCLKIPPPTSVYSETRVRRPRVVRLSGSSRSLYAGSSVQNASEQFVSCIQPIFRKFWRPEPPRSLAKTYQIIGPSTIIKIMAPEISKGPVSRSGLFVLRDKSLDLVEQGTGNVQVPACTLQRNSLPLQITSALECRWTDRTTVVSFDKKRAVWTWGLADGFQKWTERRGAVNEGRAIWT
jgi:hypothetical protein